MPEVFERRKRTLAEIERTGQYNISEKVDKLGLNGLSGKVAQSIGGSPTKPPSCYNVFYAGAIRAGTLRSIGEAALQAPHKIIQFCTDAVFNQVPLNMDEGKELGQWELEEVRDLITIQSGVYSYIKGDKTENKTRGFSTGSVATMSDLDLEAIANRMKLEGIDDEKIKMISFREALLNKVPAAWKQAAFQAGWNSRSLSRNRTCTPDLHDGRRGGRQ